jgi:hypothetical protein
MKTVSGSISPDSPEATCKICHQRISYLDNEWVHQGWLQRGCALPQRVAIPDEGLLWDDSRTAGENIATRLGLSYVSPYHDIIMELRGRATP